MKKILSFVVLAALWLGSAVAPSSAITNEQANVLLFGKATCPASVLAAANTPCPAVDANFATGKAWVKGSGLVPLSSLASITNATGGYVTNWDGSLTWKFGPVTNAVKNSTMQGAVVGVVGSGGSLPSGWSAQPATGLTYAVSGTGIDGNGFPYIDIRVSGTNSSGSTDFPAIFFNPSGASGVPSTFGQSFVTSYYVSFSAGSLSGVNSSNIGWNEFSATGTFLTTNSTSTPITATPTRIFSAKAISNASTATTTPLLVFTVLAGNSVDITLRFSEPQHEATTYATQAAPSTFIPTTNAAVTAPAQLRTGLGTGLLVEESRTNWTLQSEGLANATYWAPQNGTSVTGGQTDPLGGTNAVLWSEGTTASVTHPLNGAGPQGVLSYAAGTTYVKSIFARSNTRQLVQIFYSGTSFGGSPTADFNTTTCTVTATFGSIVAAGASWYRDGWCRIWLSATASNAGTAMAGEGFVTAIQTGTDARNPTYTGTGTTMFLWGSQLEVGSFPTSYYPTTSAAGTRATDIVFGIGPLLNVYSPSAAAVARLISSASGSPGGIFAFNDNTTSNRVDLRSNQASLINSFVTAGGVGGGQSAGGGISANTQTQVGISWQSGALSVSVNGSGFTNAAISSVPSKSAITQLRIGNFDTGSFSLNNYLQRLSFYSSPLSLATLNVLSAPQPVLVTDFANGLYTWNGYNLGAGSLASLFSVANSGGYCTTSAGLLVSFPANTLRICAGTGLLPEDTRTNSLIRSFNQYSNGSYWTQTNISIVDGNALAPDGTLTASTFSDNAALSGHSLATGGASISFTSGTTYAYSVYLKAGTFNFAQLTLGGAAFSGAGYVTVDLSSCATASGGTGILAYGAQATGNGWCRLWMVETATGSVFVPASISMVPSLSATRTQAYSGSGSTILVWGSQIEVGSFPTSYIPTSTVAVTRTNDNIQALGPVLNLLGTQGANSMVAAWAGSPYYAANASSARQYVALNGVDSGNSRWGLYSAQASGAQAPVFTVGDGAALSQVPSGLALAAGSAAKMAMRWNTSSADLAASFNGAAAATAARQFAGQLSSPWYLGGGGGSSSGALSSTLGYVGFYPGGLSNTQLQGASQ